MVEHIVLFRFRPDVSPRDISELFEHLRALSSKIDGIVAFRGGVYKSAEGLNRGYTHGFVMTFSSAQARDAYLPHPSHQRVVKMLMEKLDGGLDGALAFDLIDGVL